MKLKKSWLRWTRKSQPVSWTWVFRAVDETDSSRLIDRSTSICSATKTLLWYYRSGGQCSPVLRGRISYRCQITRHRVPILGSCRTPSQVTYPSCMAYAEPRLVDMHIDALFHALDGPSPHLHDDIPVYCEWADVLRQLTYSVDDIPQLQQVVLLTPWS
jgi:hypothetical protein